ncbi:transposase family protein [Streptomyces goshikiensis]|uniref:helix-turn-helix domain-containing protein n=1 Tax=Streptomyces goshikiensis TaxID=1942 RepID=UPI00364BF411
MRLAEPHRARRSGGCLRRPGSTQPRLIERLLATLVHLRHGISHDVLACWFGADRSTITQAIGEVRPLLAIRGCTGRLLFG